MVISSSPRVSVHACATDPTVWSSQVRALRVSTRIFASTTPPPPVPTALSPSRLSILDLRRDLLSSTPPPDDNDRGRHYRSSRSTEHGRSSQRHPQLVQAISQLAQLFLTDDISPGIRTLHKTQVTRACTRHLLKLMDPDSSRVEFCTR